MSAAHHFAVPQGAQSRACVSSARSRLLREWGSRFAVIGFTHAATAGRSSSRRFSSAGQFFPIPPRRFRPDPAVYPSGVAHTGEEIVLGDVDDCHVGLRVPVPLGPVARHPRHDRPAGCVPRRLGVAETRTSWSSRRRLPADTASITATLSLTAARADARQSLQAGSEVAARGPFPFTSRRSVRYEGTVGGRPGATGPSSRSCRSCSTPRWCSSRQANLHDPSGPQGQTLDGRAQPQPGRGEMLASDGETRLQISRDGRSP